MTIEAWIALAGLALTIIGQSIALIYAGTKFGTRIQVTVQTLVDAADRLEKSVDRLDRTVGHLDRRVSVLEDRHDRKVEDAVGAAD